MRRTVTILTVVLAALVGWSLALPPVQAAFTDSTGNGVNTFQAAATFPGEGVSGRIVDAEEAAYGIAGATVTLIQAGATIETTTSGTNGVYTFADVPSGTYDVAATRAGWSPGSRTGIEVDGNVTGVDITLAPQHFTVQGRVADVFNDGIQPNNRVRFTSAVTGQIVDSELTNTGNGDRRGCFDVQGTLRAGPWHVEVVDDARITLTPSPVEISTNHVRTGQCGTGGGNPLNLVMSQ